MPALRGGPCGPWTLSQMSLIGAASSIYPSGGYVQGTSAGRRCGYSPAWEHLVETLHRLVARHGAPKYVFVDNGNEFTGRMMDIWEYHHGVRLDFSRQGKPTDNSYVETFNGSLRDECLNIH